MIIVDDASTDGTAELLRQYRGNERVRIVTLEENRGVGYALNAGIRESDADFIATQGSDDICSADKLSRQAAVLRDDPEVKMAGSYYYVIDEAGEITGKITEEHCSSVVADIHTRLISGNCRIGAPLFRKSLWAELGGFSETDFVRYCEDYDFFLRTTERYPVGIAVVPELLYRFRNSPNSLTKNNYYAQFWAALEQSRERRRKDFEQRNGNCGTDATNFDRSRSLTHY